MVSPSGDMLPLVLAIGNHETNKHSKSRLLRRAPFYFALFPQTSLKTNFLRSLGSHSKIFVLDSGHISSHSDQVNWLEQNLKAHAPVKNKLAMYHAPLYPSHRDFDGYWSKEGRKYWQPLFDKYNLSLSFENHDHILKRTYKIKNNKKDSSGTVYIGDGCWGTSPRKARNRWYLQTSESRMHVWRVELSKYGIKGKAIGEGGRVLDEFSL